MEEKELLIQEWRKNGVDEELINEFVTYLAEEEEELLLIQQLMGTVSERDLINITSISELSHYEVELLHCRQSVSVQVPVNIGAGKIRRSLIKLSVLPEEADKSHDELLEMCFKRIFRYMGKFGVDVNDLVESFKNNLPEWSSFILPESNLDHIVTNHTLRGMIRNLFSTYVGYGKFDKKEYGRAKESIPKKLDSGASLDKTEEAIVKYLLTPEKKSIFPRNMSKQQIRSAIRDAYEDARKKGKSKYPTRRDARNWNGGSSLYQGQARDIVVCFWFDFNENVITAAYPAFKEGSARRNKF